MANDNGVSDGGHIKQQSRSSEQVEKGNLTAQHAHACRTRLQDHSVSLRRAENVATPAAGHAPTDASRKSVLPGMELNHIVKAVQAVSLDIHKSVAQLIAEGTVTDVRSPQQRLQQSKPVEQGQLSAAPSVKVVSSENNTGSTAVRADYVIKRDGSIELHNDALLNPQNGIVVQVESPGPQDKVDPRQAAVIQQSTDNLMTYLDGRLKETHPELAQSKLDIDDQQALVSREIKATLAGKPQDDPAAEAQRFSAPTAEAMKRIGNNFQADQTGVTNRSAIDSNFPEGSEKDIPRQARTADPVATLMDVRRATFVPDKDQPAQTVRSYSDGSYAFGTYGFTPNLLFDWLADLIGDPIDPAKLAALEKSNPQLAAQLKSPKFQHLMEMMRNHQKPSPEQIGQAMSPQAQKLMATDISKHLLTKAGGDPARAALSWQIGKSPDQLSKADLEDKQNQSFMAKAQNFAELSRTRQTADPIANIDWSNLNGRLLAKAKANVGQQVWARSGYDHLQGGNVGCAATWSEIYREAGYKGISSAVVPDVEAQIKSHGGRITSNPQPGDTVIFLANEGGGNLVGHHIGFISDKPGYVIDNSSSLRCVAERPLSNVASSFAGVRYWHLPNVDGTASTNSVN